MPTNGAFPCRLGDLVLTDGVDSQKFADCSNGAGMTALHVAAMKGSPQVRQLAKCRLICRSLCASE